MVTSFPWIRSVVCDVSWLNSSTVYLTQKDVSWLISSPTISGYSGCVLSTREALGSRRIWQLLCWLNFSVGHAVVARGVLVMRARIRLPTSCLLGDHGGPFRGASSNMFAQDDLSSCSWWHFILTRAIVRVVNRINLMLCRSHPEAMEGDDVGLRVKGACGLPLERIGDGDRLFRVGVAVLGRCVMPLSCIISKCFRRKKSSCCCTRACVDMVVNFTIDESVRKLLCRGTKKYIATTTLCGVGSWPSNGSKACLSASTT